MWMWVIVLTMLVFVLFCFALEVWEVWVLSVA